MFSLEGPHFVRILKKPHLRSFIFVWHHLVMISLLRLEILSRADHGTSQGNPKEWKQFKNSWSRWWFSVYIYVTIVMYTVCICIYTRCFETIGI